MTERRFREILEWLRREIDEAHCLLREKRTSIDDDVISSAEARLEVLEQALLAWSDAFADLRQANLKMNETAGKVVDVLAFHPDAPRLWETSCEGC